jgi:formylglycine-generating enzyme required for sulfatase activity
MRVRENSYGRHEATLSKVASEMTLSSRLGAWLSIHLTAYGLFLLFLEVMPIAVSGLAVRRWLCAVADAVGPNIQIIHISPTVFRQIPAYASVLFSSVLFSAVSFSFASFGFVTPAHAEVSSPLCEAAFSGSLPVLKELARLKVAATQAQAAGNRDFAITLYQLYRKSSDQAKVNGVDLRGLKAMIDEVDAKENKKSLDEETRREKTRALEEIRIIDGKRMILQPIAPGKFMMGEVGKQIETEITKPYEMAATQTTQIVWRKVVEQAKLKFPGKYDALNPDPSNFKGELNPVEQVSWDDVQLWLNALNELAAQGDPIINDVIPNHKPGEIYRLPREAEWEFIVRARGKAQGAYHFGESETELSEYAWYGANAEKQIYPVAQKKPLTIDGREFYDLHGNVWEWTQDSWDGVSPLKGGIDPLGTGGSLRVIRGGSWSNGAQALRSAYRNLWWPGDRNNVVGFRLVRALP